jgi:hypothetical protein
VVVSGDIVEGARLNDPDAVGTLRGQYAEASAFLTELCGAVIAGNRARLFLGPGNHDVCWSIARSSMRSIDRVAPEVLPLLAQANSAFRWSWSELKLFEIVDPVTYQTRLQPFKGFYDGFYESLGYVFQLAPEEQTNQYAFGDRALFTGFSSLLGNDCFQKRGRISNDAIALSNLTLRGKAIDLLPLKIAFWHHSVEPVGYGEDYLDAGDALPLLIDRGYVLGLHGHQHRSGVISYAYRLDPAKVLPLVACGSLCAGPYDIPAGYRRQYNVIEVDEANARARVHVREWYENRMWVPARLPEFGGRTFVDVDLPLMRQRIASLSSHRVNPMHSRQIELADLKLRSGDPAEARDIVGALPHDIPIVRQLHIAALEALGDWPALLGIIKEPSNTREAALSIEGQIRTGHLNGAEEMIKRCLSQPDKYDSTLLGQFRERLAVERGLRKTND